MQRTIARAAVAIVALAAGATLAAPRAAQAQWQGPSRIDAGGDLQVGGEAERYLRVIELAGLAPQQAWTIRPLAPPALFGNHPWSDHWNGAASGDSAGPGLQWRWLRPSAVGALNTTFAYNVLPGPAWDGRGL
ncbi:MAG TPA: hypothetical protein VG916_07555, partial [Gemmatimonadaceae bacterium]|nr:hypothetical protein [Gemmatimonadaceae bacterium]